MAYVEIELNPTNLVDRPPGRNRLFALNRSVDAANADVISHDYDYLTVEVDDPEAEIARIETWLKS